MNSDKANIAKSEIAPPPSSGGETTPTRQMGFPVWYDFIVILTLFAVAKTITAMIFGATDLMVSTPEGFDQMGQMAQHEVEQSLGLGIFVLTIILQPLILALVLIYRTLRHGRYGRVRHSLNGFNPTMLLWGVILLLALVVVVEPLMQLFPPTPPPDGRGLYMIAALVIVAPLFEELLCRGVILESVRQKWGAWKGCVISALIFGAMHNSAQGMANAFIIGLLLGYIYLKTNSIFAPMILHSINNIFAYVLVLFGMSNVSLYELTGGGVTYTLIYSCSVAIMILSIVAITHFLAKLRKEDKRRDALVVENNLKIDTLKYKR